MHAGTRVRNDIEICMDARAHVHTGVDVKVEARAHVPACPRLQIQSSVSLHDGCSCACPCPIETAIQTEKVIVKEAR